MIEHVHDPLCYANADCEANENYLCEQISIVRKEEREFAIERVEALKPSITFFGDVKVLESIDRQKTIAAIRGDQS